MPDDLKLKDGIPASVGAILARQRERLLHDLAELERECFDRGPTLAGAKLEAVDPNHRADLTYILDTLCQVRPALKNDALREQVTASINGMAYIIDRTRRAARGGALGEGAERRVEAFVEQRRADLEFLRLPEVLGKFADYAEKPTDENALRVIRICSGRGSAGNAGVRTPDGSQQ